MQLFLLEAVSALVLPSISVGKVSVPTLVPHADKGQVTGIPKATIDTEETNREQFQKAMLYDVWASSNLAQPTGSFSFDS